MDDPTCDRCGSPYRRTKPNQKFCGIECRTFNNRAETKAKRKGAQPPQPAYCAGCEQTFVPAQPWQRWCSRECGDRWRRRLYGEHAGPESLVRPCEYCRDPFSSPDARKKYCGVECAAVAKSLREAYRRYGITMQEYRAIWLRQGGLCAVCRQPERTERNRLLVIDHDHVTGQVRELLCSQCNRAIGLLGDDPATIRRAADYVQRNRQLRLLI